MSNLLLLQTLIPLWQFTKLFHIIASQWHWQGKNGVSILRTPMFTHTSAASLSSASVLRNQWSETTPTLLTRSLLPQESYYFPHNWFDFSWVRVHTLLSTCSLFFSGIDLSAGESTYENESKRTSLLALRTPHSSRGVFPPFSWKL